MARIYAVRAKEVVRQMAAMVMGIGRIGYKYLSTPQTDTEMKISLGDGFQKRVKGVEKER